MRAANMGKGLPAQLRNWNAPSEEGIQKLGFTEIRPLLTRFLTMLQDCLGHQLLAVALFGSFARGEATPTSDVDLLIVYRGHRQAVFNAFIRLLPLLRETPEYRELSRASILADLYPVFFSEERLADTPWLLLEVLDHGIILYDPWQILQQKLGCLQERLKELGTRKVVLEDGTWYWDLKPDWKPGEVIEL